MSTSRKATLTSSDFLNWAAIADVAWKECDDRKLTTVEKIAVTIKALHDDPDAFRVRELLVPMPQKAVCAVLRSHLGLINEVLGTTYRYMGASYAASGRGAFGRLGGGRLGSYNEPCLLSGC